MNRVVDAPSSELVDRLTGVFKQSVVDQLGFAGGRQRGDKPGNVVDEKPSLALLFAKSVLRALAVIDVNK